MSSKKKNAIFMLLIRNPQYIIGAITVAYSHRKMLEYAGIKNETDLVIMCDNELYEKYNDLLNNSLFFDIVEKIELRDFKDASGYQYAKKYSSWMGASLNKWQCIKYEQYEKIMFVDVALLPVRPEFYDLFKLPSPSVLIQKSVLNDPKDLDCKDGLVVDFPNNPNLTYDEYLKNEDKYGSMHGNLVVIKPNKKLYDEYVELTNDIYENGIYSVYKSGPDVTSLYYFFINKQIPIHSICHENATIPWDEPILIDISKGYEFSSLYKPWIKPKILCWPEEILWRDIFNIITKKLYKRIFSRPLTVTTERETQNIVVIGPDPNSAAAAEQLKIIFETTIVDTFRKYIELDQRSQQKNFGGGFIKRFRNDFDMIVKMIKTEPNNEDSNSRIFSAIMKIDSKIYLKYYGNLKTSKLTEIL